MTNNKTGGYAYTVKGVNENANGYTYDDKVYTVKFIIEPDQNNPGDFICTQQTILDGENEVEFCEFVNNYESTENGDDNKGYSYSDDQTDISILDNYEPIENADDGTLENNSVFAKTGDRIYLIAVIFVLIALICGVSMVVFRKRKSV